MLMMIVIMMLFIINMQCRGNALSFLLMAGTVVYIAMQVLNLPAFSV